MNTQENNENAAVNNFNHLVRDMEYFEDNREEMFPLLDGFMSSIETMLLHGQAGSGKSLFTYSLVRALASDDGEFLGIPCAKGLKVLFCDGEMHNNTIADRAKTLGKHPNIQYISTTDAIKVDKKAINLSDDEDKYKLIQTIKDGGFKVVVFDSVRTLWSMDDENSSSDWRTLNDLITHLRNLNCAVIFVHHNNKTGNYSGSSNAETYVDRTCAIEQAGKGMWCLKIGSKMGRDKMGWSEEIQTLC